MISGEISIWGQIFAWLIQNFYLVGFFGQKCIIEELWAICCHRGICISDTTKILIFVHMGVFMTVCWTTLMCTWREIIFLWRGKLTRTFFCCWNFSYVSIISENFNGNGPLFSAHFVISYTKWTHFVSKTRFWQESIFGEICVMSARERPWY